ncbi:hypothetical protein [Gilliamella bombi]|uniref:hypothetical protein n=1 Tax=Gilliamella bombi TaxID=1908521 RepID=UPI001428A838|nr:hypothetical protein [Gilliamella bombi]
MKKNFLTVLIAGFLMIGCDDKPTENKRNNQQQLQKLNLLSLKLLKMFHGNLH